MINYTDKHLTSFFTINRLKSFIKLFKLYFDRDGRFESVGYYKQKETMPSFKQVAFSPMIRVSCFFDSWAKFTTLHSDLLTYFSTCRSREDTTTQHYIIIKSVSPLIRLLEVYGLNVRVSAIHQSGA